MTIIPIEVAFFWAKVKVGGAAQCWEWQGAKMGRDMEYGKFRDKPAHRVSYEMHKGKIPDGFVVRHMCGKKSCVNPAHLEIGTHRDNYADRYVLGEGLGTLAAKGEENAKAKLTEAEARYIIDNPDGYTGSHLALKFGVSKATITLIQQGKRWAHLHQRKSA